MKNLLFILFALFSSFYVIAQKRPMTLEVIEPKLDSIHKEADILYQYTIVTRTASIMAGEKLGSNISASEIIVYPKSDTLVAVAFPKNSQKMYEAHFVSGQKVWDSTTTRMLSTAEKELLELKDTLLKQSRDKDYNIIKPEGYGLDYTMFPINGGYHFYVLTTTEKENLIPFGNAYIFISNKEGHINSFKKVYPEFNPTSTLGPRGFVFNMIMPSYPVEEPFIHAADICNFRIYGVPAGVEKLGVHSIRNKRMTTYDPKSYELKIGW